MTGGGLGVAKCQPGQQAASGHGFVGGGGIFQQAVNSPHYRGDGLQSQAPGHSIGVVGPVALHRMGGSIQGRGHRQLHGHPLGQLRVYQGGVGVVFLALQRALAVLLRIPDGGPAGDLASGTRCGGHADPLGGGM